jgi:hypothetical protein
MRGYLSGELLQHMVGVDLVPFPEVPLCPAFLLLLPAGLALASQLPVRLTHLILYAPLLLHTAHKHCCQRSARFFGQRRKSQRIKIHRLGYRFSIVFKSIP